MASTQKKSRVGVWKGERMSDTLIGLLHHPLRRAILRTLNGHETPRSPTELADLLSTSLSNASHHTAVLKEAGVLVLKGTAKKRGATAHYYSSALAENPLVKTILAETAEEDKGRVLKYKSSKRGRKKGRTPRR